MNGLKVSKQGGPKRSGVLFISYGGLDSESKMGNGAKVQGVSRSLWKEKSVFGKVKVCMFEGILVLIVFNGLVLGPEYKRKYEGGCVGIEMV